MSFLDLNGTTEKYDLLQIIYIFFFQQHGQCLNTRHYGAFALRVNTVSVCRDPKTFFSFWLTIWGEEKKKKESCLVYIFTLHYMGNTSAANRWAPSFEGLTGENITGLFSVQTILLFVIELVPFLQCGKTIAKHIERCRYQSRGDKRIISSARNNRTPIFFFFLCFLHSFSRVTYIWDWCICFLETILIQCINFLNFWNDLFLNIISRFSLSRCSIVYDNLFLSRPWPILENILVFFLLLSFILDLDENLVANNVSNVTISVYSAGDDHYTVLNMQPDPQSVTTADVFDPLRCEMSSKL